MTAVPQPLSSPPLRLQQRLNQQPQALGSWLARWWRSIRHSKIIEQQLATRSDVEHTWAAAGFELPLAKAVSEAVAVSQGWPSARFIPADPLDLLVDDAFESLSSLELVYELEERLSVQLSEEELQELCALNTVGDLVRWCGSLFQARHDG
jgi:acyl carrier protein